jgi:hypothetical protein
MSCGIYVNFDISNLYSFRYARDLTLETFTPDKNTFSVNSEVITPTKKFVIDSIVRSIENKFTLKFDRPQTFNNAMFYYASGYTSPFTATTENFTINSQVWNTEKTELTISVTPKITMDSFSDRILILIDGSAPPPPPTKYKVVITGAIQNATCNYENNEDVDNSKDVIITANEGFYWDKTYYPLVIQPDDDDIRTFDISADKKKLTFKIPSDLSGNIELDSNYVAKKLEEVYKVLITGTIKNATCNYSNNEIIDIAKKPKIIITATNGYFFTSRNYHLKVNHLSSPYFDYSRTTLTYDITSITLGTNIELYDNYVANKPVIKVSEFNHLYEITEDELSKLAAERFSVSDTGIVDYGVYINSLYKLPFKIDPSLLGDKESIKLGRFSASAQSAIITTDTLNFTLPTITCEEKYENVYDYKNVKAILYAPFFQPIELDIQYVMNCTLTVNMILNLYVNKMAIFIKSSFNESIVHFDEVTVGTNIPFVTAEYNFVNARDIEFNPNVTNQMVLEITRKIPLQTNLKYHINKIYDSLNNYNGFISVNNLEIVTTATSNEYDEIVNLLNQGIFINNI